MRCKKCPMAKDECCTICDQNDFLTAERPLPDQDELLAALKRERIAAQSLGIAEGALAEAVAYTKSRVQFGKPISKFQNTQFTLADMELGCEAGRLLIYQAAVAKGEGRRYTKLAAMAKLFCSEHAMKTTTKALQMFGGYGYTKDFPMERMMRDAKITEIYEGTSEVQRMVIASNLGVK